MTRYFFNLRSGHDYLADDEGAECPTLQVAGVRAAAGARALLNEVRALQRSPQTTAFEITDAQGRMRLRVPFTVAQRGQTSAVGNEFRPAPGLA